MKWFGYFKQRHRLFFFLAWFVINLVQAATTELLDDEAYYWIYSQYPAWGYFDHPPMIAWLIKAGYSVFQDELGLRLFMVVLNTATVLLIRDLIASKNDPLFYAIAASIAVAQIGGIIAVPDIPLLFFVALFFWVYRKFAAGLSLSSTIMLGVTVALMLYSKYHGILIVFFTLLSNPVLFRRYQTYLVALIALALFFPHLYWQYTHGFPSVQFHLFERNAVSYRFSFTSEYILGQIILAGPLIGWLLLWLAFSYRPVSLTEKAMKFSLVGIYLVFLLSTFKGRAEANWTVPAFVGLMVLGHQALLQKPQWMRWVYWATPVTLLIVFAARIYMMIDSSTPRFGKDEFHANKEAARAIKAKAGDLPVVIIDSYQKPAKYSFYGKGIAFALNTPNYRRNNYNYWPIEETLFGKKVFAIGPKYGPFTDSIPAARFKDNKSTFIDYYYSFSKVRISKIQEELVNAELLQFTAMVESPGAYIDHYQRTPYDTASVILAVYDKRGDVAGYIPSSFRLKALTDSSQSITLSFSHHLTAGKYSARMAISSCLPGFPSMNSSAFKFELK